MNSRGNFSIEVVDTVGQTDDKVTGVAYFDAVVRLRMSTIQQAEAVDKVWTGRKWVIDNLDDVDVVLNEATAAHDRELAKLRAAQDEFARDLLRPFGATPLFRRLGAELKVGFHAQAWFLERVMPLPRRFLRSDLDSPPSVSFYLPQLTELPDDFLCSPREGRRSLVSWLSDGPSP